MLYKLSVLSISVLVFASLVASLQGVIQFRCNDNTKVALRLVCDGVDNCPDGSDESSNTCSKSRCLSKRWFRCNYGACISKDKKCDGRKDCKDDSDEANCGHENLSCNLNEWRCSTGKCIPLRAACNGTSECTDKSDESPDVCSEAKCIGSEVFQCKYGACIPRSLTCDNVPHCSDASDEAPQLCGSSCKVPQVSPPLHVNIVGCNNSVECSSTEVDDLGVISFSCDPGYVLQGEQFLFCVKRQWQPPQTATCVPVPVGGDGSCPDLDDVTNDIEVTCSSMTGDPTSCSRPLPVGTVAMFQCRQNSQQHSEATCKEGGVWSALPPICEPKCGIAGTLAYRNSKSNEKVTNSPSNHRTRLPGNTTSTAGIFTNLGLSILRLTHWPFLPEIESSFTDINSEIVHGSEAFPGQWPWHIGLYFNKSTGVNESEWKYQCGGTIISDTAVITAAHCVYKRAAEKLMIAVGKFERPYNLSETEVQYIAISQIHIPDIYIGDVNFYDSDIAILGLAERIEFSPNVRPACMDWKRTQANSQLVDDGVGVLAGWGFTESNMESDILLFTKLSFVNTNSCVNVVPADFRRFLRASTFCAGTSNGVATHKYGVVQCVLVDCSKLGSSNEEETELQLGEHDSKEGTSACNGDSGGGLLFPLGPESPEVPWVLQGLVSLSVRKLNDVLCDPKYPTIFTRVVNYMDFVVEKMKQTAEPFLDARN